MKNAQKHSIKYNFCNTILKYDFYKTVKNRNWKFRLVNPRLKWFLRQLQKIFEVQNREMSKKRCKTFLILDLCWMSGNAKPISNVTQILLDQTLAIFYFCSTVQNKDDWVQTF